MSTTLAVVKTRPEKNSGLYGIWLSFAKNFGLYSKCLWQAVDCVLEKGMMVYWSWACICENKKIQS